MMHIQSMKEVTKHKKITDLDDPDILLVPLFEKFGIKPEATVKPGENVLKYQVIGKSAEGFSSPVHAPVSGTVKKVERIRQYDGSEALTVFIKNNGLNAEVANPLHDVDTNSPEQLLELINEAGIVGLGGAQFPTAKKYNRKGKNVKTFILNGAECEPYLTSDYALMTQYTTELLEGILLIDKILDAEEIVIAFEKENEELTATFGEYLKNSRYQKVRTQVVPNQYPQGGELQLAKTVTGTVIPKGAVTIDYGIVVSNVGTAYAVYEAVVNRKPLIERFITVSGENVSKPGNYRIKIGTQISHIIKCCSIATESSNLVSGGPMMSPHIQSFDTPLHKGSLGLVAIPKEELVRMNCIWCGYCVDVCPMKLMPMKYDQLFRQEKYAKLGDYDIEDCISCGSCEYICPSNVPLMESIEKGKNKLKEINDAADKKNV